MSSGNFRQGYKTGTTPVPWPTPARINLMRRYAQDADAADGDYDITAGTIGSRIPATRIEFVTIDVNGDGVIEWDEGFMRVWKAGQYQRLRPGIRHRPALAQGVWWRRGHPAATTT